MKHRLIILLACFCFSVYAEEKTDSTSAWEIPKDKNKFHVFALMGQSNMAGFGCAAGSDPWQEGDKDPVPHILILRGQCKINSENTTRKIEWVPGAHRIHLNQGTAQFGLGMDFAKSYQTNFTEKITVGLVPCAWGGAPIKGLTKGTPIYKNAIKRLKIASKQGTLKGILWHQGESDTVSPKLVELYERKLKKLISDITGMYGVSFLIVMYLSSL